MTIGQTTLSVLLFLSYGLPMLGNFFFQWELANVSDYHFYPLTPRALFFMASTLFLFFAISASPFYQRLHLPAAWLTKPFKKGAAFYREHRMRLAIASLLFAFIFSALRLATWRYASTRIADSHSYFLMSGIVLCSVIRTDLFYFMFAREKRVTFFSKLWLENILLSLALCLLIDGSVSAILTFFILFYSVVPSLFDQLFFWSRDTLRPQRIQKTFGLCLLWITIFCLAWSYGEGLKGSATEPVRFQQTPAVSINEPEHSPREVPPKEISLGSIYAARLKVAGSKLQQIFSTKFLLYFIERISVHYYSLLMVLKLEPSEMSQGLSSHLLIPLQSAAFRLDVLTGKRFHVQRPEISSISQLNYRLLSKSPTNPREGSSPGLLASFVYTFGFPLSILLAALYLVALARLLDVLIFTPVNKSIPFLGVILIAIFGKNFSDSPLDFLLIFDNSVVDAFLIICLYVWQEVKQRAPVKSPIPFTSFELGVIR